jgi:hypothetical protein
VLISESGLEVRRIGSPPENAWVFPPANKLAAGGTAVEGIGDGLFSKYVLPKQNALTEVGVKLRAVSRRPARWEIDVPANALQDAFDVYLSIDYLGDLARIRVADRLLADHFYYGPAWRPSLRHWGAPALGQTLVLEIEPISPNTRAYLEPEARPEFASDKEELAEIVSFRIEPQYRVVLTSIATKAENGMSGVGQR